MRRAMLREKIQRKGEKERGVGWGGGREGASTT